MPSRPHPLYLGFVIMVILGLAHAAALSFYLYWSYWWFDWVMHSLMGLAIGLVVYWAIFDLSGPLRLRPKSLLTPFLVIFLTLITIGVAWEIFEYVLGLTDSYEASYALDVINDLLADSIGAILAAFIGIKHTSLSTSRFQ